MTKGSIYEFKGKKGPDSIAFPGTASHHPGRQKDSKMGTGWLKSPRSCILPFSEQLLKASSNYLNKKFTLKIICGD